jgi:4-amino-4-deoxy-L-arabinose transferase-like glycosyltransferase
MTDSVELAGVAPAAANEVARTRAPRRPSFALLLLLIAVAAFGLRAGVLWHYQDAPLSGDGLGYSWAAAEFGEHPYTDAVFPGEPSAHHPPMWATILGVGYGAGLDTLLRLQMLAACLGTGAVVLVGLAGRQIAGRRVGLLAAAIAAVYPGFWKFERDLLSETVTLGLMALILLLAYRYRERPGGWAALALGGAMGLGLLNKADLILLLPFLVLPLVLATSQPLRNRLIHLVTIGGVAILMVLPWSIYNSTRFERPVPLSTGLGSAMRIAACDQSFYGEKTGYWEFGCSIFDKANVPGQDRAVTDARFRDEAIDYIGDHAGRYPVVLAARFGRTWSLYRPGQQINLDHAWSLAPKPVLWAQLLTFWALVLPTVAGIPALRRRHIAVWPLLVPFGCVVITNLAVTGEPRYRSPAEVSIVILAAAGLDAAWRWWRRRSRQERLAIGPDTTSVGAPDGDDRATPSPDGREELAVTGSRASPAPP